MLEEFAIAVGSVIIAPLAPIVIELGFTGSVTQSTLLISAIMYIAALAFGTDRKIIFWLGFCAVAYLCMVYGAQFKVAEANAEVLGNQGAQMGSAAANVNQAEKISKNSNAVYNSAIILMICFGLAHFFQRWRMHLLEAQPFLDFRATSKHVNATEEA